MFPLLSIREDSTPDHLRDDPPGRVDRRRKTLNKSATTIQTQLERKQSPRPSRSWAYHIETIWLFTFSDLKTIIGPKTFFGLAHALCINVFQPPSEAPQIKTLTGSDAYRIAPVVLFWVWINLLPFAINNQRKPASVLEDRVNKPWRPMPSDRISFRVATTIMFVFYGLAFFASLALGGLRQHLTLIALGFWYNDLGGADVSCFTRNLINGLGFICFGTGAMEVALGGSAVLWTPTMVKWQALIVALVTTSVHTQDMYDQEGDSLRGRWTVPLSLGDGFSRWTIAAAVPFWSVVATRFWDLSLGACVVPALLGLTVAARTLTRRTVSQDKTTFKIWNLWVVSIYTLPLIKSISGF